MSSATSLFTYTADDLPLTATLNIGPSALSEVRQYDADNWLVGLQASGPISTAWTQSFGYGYDPQGHTITVTANGASQPLVYDALGRLTSGEGDSDTYDSTGNILTAAAPASYVTYQYAYAPGYATPPNALPNELVATIQSGGATTGYGYDASGDTTVIGTATLTKTLRYDAQSRLTGVVVTNTADSFQDVSVALRYNARGLRSRYTVTTAGQSQPAFDEQVLYRGTQVGQVVVSGTATTPFTETFVYRPDGSPLELLYGQSGQATQRYWYVLDGRHNVVALTDSTGTLVDQYAYDAWGRPDLSTPGATQESIHQPLRYGGYWYDGWDDALGTWNSASAALPWYWVGAREYDPTLERYLQPDPASAGGLPDYVYADDDPLDETDPSGLAGVPLGCAASAALVDATQAAGCARAGAQARRDAQTQAALWAIPNAFVLDPLRAAVGANSSLLDRGLGVLALLPVAGWVGHGVGLAADVARGLFAAADVARSAEIATNAASDAATTADTAMAAETAVSDNGGGDFVDFAHGTTSEAAQDIVNNGLNRDAALEGMVGSREPGSFFTVQVDPLNPNDALELAASWATRHSTEDICIVICRLPRSVVESLESSRLLVHRFQPPESIFRPDSFDIVNREATWFSFKVR